MPSQRPFQLDPYFIGVRRIPGVGDKTGEAFERLCGSSLFSILRHIPIDIIDRRTVKQIKDLKKDEVATIIVDIVSHTPSKSRRHPYRVKAEDESGEITLVFFRAYESTIQKNFPVGKKIAVSGTVDFYQGFAQMTHPDRSAPANKIEEIAKLEPIYPLTSGIGHAQLLKAVDFALQKVPELDEWHDPAIISKNNWPPFKQSLTTLHHPDTVNDIAPTSKARERLAYDEALALQLTLALIRQRNKQIGRPIDVKETAVESAIKALPFELTGGQVEAISDIKQDMSANTRMMRLLQGDVGAGKTAVAFVAIAAAAADGKQAALMAPTEILARQHLATLQQWCHKIGLTAAILTGRERGKVREEILSSLESGEIDVLIGTHALFQHGVNFKDLALTVIDEQHRFGVDQRLRLTSKGNLTDVLVMTATPIPRTLTLTLYGDMDVTRLTEKPAGRQPIETRILPSTKLQQLVHSLQTKIDDGEQIFWVCPLVEESEKVDLAAAEDRFKALSNHFPGQVGLVHGQMSGDQKDEAMEAFLNKETKILVSTTVIEVGVDVPDATVMIIEHAERFGLSQLHQLRGRVGRGEKPSSCLLVYYTPLGDTARKRLETMRETNDGFIIAEQDLKLRGGGELLGTRQSGLPDFDFLNLSSHQSLLRTAQDDARLIIQKDPSLVNERGKELKNLLYLFGMDRAIKYLESG